MLEGDETSAELIDMVDETGNIAVGSARDFANQYNNNSDDWDSEHGTLQDAEQLAEDALAERAAYLEWRANGGLSIEEQRLTEAYNAFINDGGTRDEWFAAQAQAASNPAADTADLDPFADDTVVQPDAASDNLAPNADERYDARFSVAPVYTGSAADYDKPSLHFVGSGEGSQVYGWGLYASTVRGVAERYLPHERTAQEKAYIESLKRNIASEKSPILKKHWESELKLAQHPQRNLYEQTFFTDRAPGDESHLLKWYEPISEEQAQWVFDELKKIDKYITSKDLSLLKSMIGKKLYETVSAEMGAILKTPGGYNPKAASEFLARVGIDGVKYPVDSYGGKTVKDGDTAGWNYVSFRDDNIRVDHKWTDGIQRYSVTTHVYNPDAMVSVVDGRNEPEFTNLTTAEIRNYIREKYMGREVSVDSDGTVVVFTGEGLNAAMKKRGKHRRILHTLNALVKNAHYTRFEQNDGQPKHKHLNGQLVYTAALRLKDGVFGVELKLDLPKSDPDKTYFKGQTLKTKIADAVLSVGPRSEEPLPTSDYEASASGTIRLGDIVTTPDNIPYSPSARQVGAASSSADLALARYSVARTYADREQYPLEKLDDLATAGDRDAMAEWLLRRQDRLAALALFRQATKRSSRD